MQFQNLISLKNKTKIFQNIICCCCDWRFKAYSTYVVEKVFFANETRICFPSTSKGGSKAFNISNTFMDSATDASSRKPYPIEAPEVGSLIIWIFLHVICVVFKHLSMVSSVVNASRPRNRRAVTIHSYCFYFSINT